LLLDAAPMMRSLGGRGKSKGCTAAIPSCC